MNPAGAVVFVAADPSGADAQRALRSYLAEIAARIPHGETGPDDADAVDDYRAPDGVFLVAWADDRVVGCGAIRTLGPGLGEVKRMWIDPAVRGRGEGGRLLDALEAAAADLGHERLRLDTHEVLVEAIALYEAHGYRRIERYHDDPDPTHFYEKVLPGPREAAQPAPPPAR
jgi:GNAT superfamily N-acetyltransferase